MTICNTCNVKLNDENWYASLKQCRHLICKFCYLSNNRFKYNKERNKIKVKKYNRDLKIKVINNYGGECSCCGEKELEFLTIDHIENDGAKDRKLIGGGIKFYLWLKKQNYPQNNKYQVLCYNCNICKEHFGICAHAFKKQNYATNCELCEINLTDRTVYSKSKGNFHPFFDKSNIYMCLNCSLNIKGTKSLNSKIAKLNRRFRVLEGFGGKCEFCDENRYCFLSIDHIFGRKNDIKFNSPRDFYDYLINNNYPKDNYRILCYNCNCRLGHFNR